MTNHNFPKTFHPKELRENVTDRIINVPEDTISQNKTIEIDVNGTVNRYQALLNRFRRKRTNTDFSIIDIKSNNISFNNNKRVEYVKTSKLAKDFKYNFIVRNNSSSVRLTRQNAKIDQKKKETMGKIKLDDSTQTRLFHDYSVTVNRSAWRKELANDTENSNIDVKNINFRKNKQIGRDVTLTASNDSLVPENLTHPSIRNVLKSTKPTFTDGKLL